MSQNRFSQIKVDGLKIDQLGYLRTTGKATRVGVLTYLRPTGEVVREYRPAEEVFNADSMKSLRAQVITDKHPAGGKVHSKNAKSLQVGFTGDVAKAEPWLEPEITITTEDGIDALKSGRQELSCGYSCDHDYTPGIFEGQAYDLIQRNIRYNHLALVDRGRAGPEGRIRLDAEDAVEFDGEDQKKKLLEEMNMKKITLGGKEFQVDEAVAEAIAADLKTSQDKVDAAQAKIDAADSAKKTVEATLVEANKAKDALQAKVDAADKKETKTDAGEVNKLVNARLTIVRTAEQVLGTDAVKLDMSDKDIKIAVVKADDKDFDPKDKTDAYIDARFDIAVESAKKNGRVDLGTRINNPSTTKTDADEKRATAKAEAQNAWQKPLVSHA